MCGGGAGKRGDASQQGSGSTTFTAYLPNGATLPGSQINQVLTKYSEPSTHSVTTERFLNFLYKTQLWRMLQKT